MRSIYWNFEQLQFLIDVAVVDVLLLEVAVRHGLLPLAEQLTLAEIRQDLLNALEIFEVEGAIFALRYYGTGGRCPQFLPDYLVPDDNVLYNFVVAPQVEAILSFAPFDDLVQKFVRLQASPVILYIAMVVPEKSELLQYLDAHLDVLEGFPRLENSLHGWLV